MGTLRQTTAAKQEPPMPAALLLGPSLSLASCQASGPRPSHLPFTLLSSVGPPGPAVCPWTRRRPMLPGAWASRHLPHPLHTCQQPAAIFRRLLQQWSLSLRASGFPCSQTSTGHRSGGVSRWEQCLVSPQSQRLLGTHWLQTRAVEVAERPLPPRSAPQHLPCGSDRPCLPLGAHTQLDSSRNRTFQSRGNAAASEQGAPSPSQGAGR